MIHNNTIFLIILLYALSPLHMAFSQPWTEPVNISTMNGSNQQPDLFIENSGAIHCVWAHTIENDYGHIYYSNSVDNGLTWSNPFNVSMNTEQRPIYPKTVADSDGKVYISYTDDLYGYTNKKVLMKTFDGTSWSQPDTVSGDMLLSTKNKMVIDNNDNIYVFWNHAIEGGNYYYRVLDNSEWGPILHPYPGIDLSIHKLVVDSDNNIHGLCGWLDESWIYGYFKFDASQDSWSDITQISERTWGHLGADIDIDSQNNPHFAWRHKTYYVGNIDEEDSTMYRYYDGVSWTEPELVAEDPNGQLLQLINDNPYIVEWEKSGGSFGNLVCYEKNNYENWIGELIVTEVARTEVLVKSSNSLNLLYKSKIDDDVLNIYFTKKAVDTTTNIELSKFNLKTLNIYPNPFTYSTNINFSVVNKSKVLIKVYSFTGELIKTIENIILEKDDYVYTWDGTDKNGRKVNNGIYLIRLQAGRNIISRSVEYMN